MTARGAAVYSPARATEGLGLHWPTEIPREGKPRPSQAHGKGI